MHSTAVITATVAASLAALTAASTVPTRLERRDEPVFSVVHYTAGCSKGGCVNSFNVSAPAGYVADAPTFEATCSAVLDRKGWTPCRGLDGSDLPDGNRVENRLGEGPDRLMHYVWVSHVFKKQDGTQVNRTGHHDFLYSTPGAQLDFKIPVGTDAPAKC